MREKSHAAQRANGRNILLKSEYYVGRASLVPVLSLNKRSRHESEEKEFWPDGRRCSMLPTPLELRSMGWHSVEHLDYGQALRCG